MRSPGVTPLLLLAALATTVATTLATTQCGQSSGQGGTGSDGGANDATAGVDVGGQGDAAAPLDAASATDAIGSDTGPSQGAPDSGSDSSAPRDGGARSLPYMVGIKTNGVQNGPATVQGWLGRPLDVAGTTITTTSYVGGSNSKYTDESGALPLLEVSFPLVSIFSEPNPITDMAQAAAGAYDATYEAMSQHLAAFPNPLLSARIGWEFNGNWYAWSSGVGTNATYANYVSAFQHAAIMLRKHNPHVLIQWCVAWGQPDPTPYWPGAYDATNNPGGVDVVSMDFYQANISQYNNGGNTSAWSLAQSGVTIDLDWMVTFAQAKGVKVALSEYGAGRPSSGGIGSGPGLDDGTWTAASIAWMNSLPAGLFLWTAWSDDGPADDIVTPGKNPAEQAAWSAAWAGTSFGGSWWKGTPPPM